MVQRIELVQLLQQLIKYFILLGYSLTNLTLVLLAFVYKLIAIIDEFILLLVFLRKFISAILIDDLLQSGYNIICIFLCIVGVQLDLLALLLNIFILFNQFIQSLF